MLGVGSLKIQPLAFQYSQPRCPHWAPWFLSVDDVHHPFDWPVSMSKRGIRPLHPAQEKQAMPLQLDELERVVGAPDRAAARLDNDRAGEFRNLRDGSLILLGFWRGFRSDELCRLRAVHVEAKADEDICCFLERTKGDQQNLGTTFKMPALTRLCPVDAYLDWISAAQLCTGTVYRPIDRWDHVGEREMHVDSIAPLLRAILGNGGLDGAKAYSSHSLRRRFANWAASNG